MEKYRLAYFGQQGQVENIIEGVSADVAQENIRVSAAPVKLLNCYASKRGTLTQRLGMSPMGKGCDMVGSYLQKFSCDNDAVNWQTIRCALSNESTEKREGVGSLKIALAGGGTGHWWKILDPSQDWSSYTYMYVWTNILATDTIRMRIYSIGENWIEWNMMAPENWHRWDLDLMNPGSSGGSLDRAAVTKLEFSVLSGAVTTIYMDDIGFHDIAASDCANIMITGMRTSKGQGGIMVLKGGTLYAGDAGLVANDDKAAGEAV